MCTVQRRKQELEQYLKEVQTSCYYMTKALHRDDEQGEQIAYRSIKSTLPVIDALYEELQRLRGK